MVQPGQPLKKPSPINLAAKLKFSKLLKASAAKDSAAPWIRLQKQVLPLAWRGSHDTRKTTRKSVIYELKAVAVEHVIGLIAVSYHGRRKIFEGIGKQRQPKKNSFLNQLKLSTMKTSFSF